MCELVCCVVVVKLVGTQLAGNEREKGEAASTGFKYDKSSWETVDKSDLEAQGMYSTLQAASIGFKYDKSSWETVDKSDLEAQGMYSTLQAASIGFKYDKSSWETVDK